MAADDLGSWISQSILDHDKRTGADLRRIWEGKRYCQLVKFITYRTREDPHKQICAVVADSRHRVDVVFDRKETDAFERLTGESLTSHLRVIFCITSFRLHLLPPQSGSHQAELPRVRLEVLDWSVHSGDRNDPILSESAPVIGRGRGDGEIQRILRKWWFGESNSSQSHNISSSAEMPEAGPSSLPVKYEPPQTPSASRIILKDYLDPYIRPQTKDGKAKVKTIPEFLFEIPPEAQKELDKIRIFGLELAPHINNEDILPSSPPKDTDDISKPPRTPFKPNLRSSSPLFGASHQKGKSKDETSSPSLSFPQPGQVLPSGTQGLSELVPSAVDRNDAQLDMDDDDIAADEMEEKGKREEGKISDDEGDNGEGEESGEGLDGDDLPIRPVRRAQRHKHKINLLSFSSPPVEASSIQPPHQSVERHHSSPNPDDNVDAEEAVASGDMSEYSLQRRHQRQQLEAAQSTETMDVDWVDQSTGEISMGDKFSSQSAAQQESNSQSFPESEHSREYLGLARYAKAAMDVNSSSLPPPTSSLADEAKTTGEHSAARSPFEAMGTTTREDHTVDLALTSPANSEIGPHPLPHNVVQPTHEMRSPAASESTQDRPKVSPSALSMFNPLSVIRAVTRSKERDSGESNPTESQSAEGTAQKDSLWTMLTGRPKASEELPREVNEHHDVHGSTDAEQANVGAKEQVDTVAGDTNETDEAQPGGVGTSLDADVEIPEPTQGPREVEESEDSEEHIDLGDFPSPPPDSPPARYRSLANILRRSMEPGSAKRARSFTPTIERTKRIRQSLSPLRTVAQEHQHDVFGPTTHDAPPERLLFRRPTPSPDSQLAVGQYSDHDSAGNADDISHTDAKSERDPVSPVARDEPPSPMVKTEQDVTTRLADHLPILAGALPRKKRRLNGFRPDLSVPSHLGVSESYVQDVLQAARRHRARAIRG